MTASSEWDEELYEDGYRAGRDWARGWAERGELRRLRRFWESLPFHMRRRCGVCDIVCAIEPSLNDCLSVREQSEEIIGRWEWMTDRDDTDSRETEFAVGFCAGALGLNPPVEIENDDGDRASAIDVMGSVPTKSIQENGSSLRDAEYGKNYRPLDLNTPRLED